MSKDKRTVEENTKKARVWNKTRGHCHLCGERLVYGGDWQIDHLVPRHAGGVDEEWNFLPICGFCNRMKKAARTYKMRRVLMYGRYCLDEATRRATSESGQVIYDVVGRRVKRVSRRSRDKPLHVQLWKQTEKQPG
jgi:5-methylcytosine-specific restriction endonuclease McrA